MWKMIVKANCSRERKMRSRSIWSLLAGGSVCRHEVLDSFKSDEADSMPGRAHRLTLLRLIGGQTGRFDSTSVLEYTSACHLRNFISTDSYAGRIMRPAWRFRSRR